MHRPFALPVLLLCAPLLGCVTSAPTREQRFSAWMMERGEIMLFMTHAAHIDATPGHGSRIKCMSGVLANGPRKLRSWDGKRVIVTGKVVDYESLRDDGAPVLPRKVLAGYVVPNFCLGKQVMLITHQDLMRMGVRIGPFGQRRGFFASRQSRLIGIESVS